MHIFSEKIGRQSAEGAMHSIDFCEEEKRAPETSSEVRLGWKLKGIFETYMCFGDCRKDASGKVGR